MFDPLIRNKLIKHDYKKGSSYNGKGAVADQEDHLRLFLSYFG